MKDCKRCVRFTICKDALSMGWGWMFRDKTAINCPMYEVSKTPMIVGIIILTLIIIYVGLGVLTGNWNWG